MIRESSLDAYRTLERSGDLQRREREVMLAIHDHFPYPRTFTRKELSERMGWAINRICGRILTLRDRGYLDELTQRRDGGCLLQIRPAQLPLELAA
jgi:hypothetical protein